MSIVEKLKQLKEHFEGRTFVPKHDNSSVCKILKSNEYCTLKDVPMVRAFERKLNEARISVLPYFGNSDSTNIIIRCAGGTCAKLCCCTRPFGASSQVSITEFIRRIDKRVAKVTKKIKPKC